MQPYTALEIKILSFLQQAGVPVDPAAASSLQLVRFFEAEFGCDVLGMLEREYWEEQIQLDITDGWFGRLRGGLDDERSTALDGLLAQLLGGPDPLRSDHAY